MTPTDAITLKINSYMDTLNDAVKVPDFSITLEKTKGEPDELDDLNRRVMSLSMTDNRASKPIRLLSAWTILTAKCSSQSAARSLPYRWDGKVKP